MSKRNHINYNKYPNFMNFLSWGVKQNLNHFSIFKNHIEILILKIRQENYIEEQIGSSPIELEIGINYSIT